MPSLLLHPLDFLGRDDVPELAFFPAMERPGERKRAASARFIDAYLRRFDVIPLERHAKIAS